MIQKTIDRLLVHNIYNKKILILKCLVIIIFLLFQLLFDLLAGINYLHEFAAFILGALFLSVALSGIAFILVIIDINSHHLIGKILQFGSSTDERNANAPILLIAFIWKLLITLNPLFITLHFYILLGHILLIQFPIDTQVFIEALSSRNTNIGILGFSCATIIMHIIYLNIAHPILKIVEKKYYSSGEV